jgi:proteasome assembly chaperone (PAC2) family protein
MGFFKKYFLSEKIIMSLFQKASFKYINLKINNDDIQKEKENMEDFINEITVEKESGLSFNK